MRRLPLRTRLAATFGVLFVLAGGGVTALTVALAAHSIDAANSASTPAVRDLKAAISNALAGTRPTGSGAAYPAGKTAPQASGQPGSSQAAAKRQAALAEARTRQQLLDANHAYAAATSTEARRRLIIWSSIAAA